MPFLSIIIPVYNAEKTISECLESIWNQGISEIDYEVICVDDCSSDTTLAILNREREKHKNLRIEINSVNLRAGGARNNGVRVANGEYIIFLDSDDYYHSESLKKAFEYLKANPDLDILTCNFARELPGKSSSAFVHRYYSEEKLSLADYISANHFIPCGPCQWFFKRKLMTDHDIWFREHTICEDVDWTHRLVLEAKVIQYQPILLSHYVIDSGSQTGLSYARPANVYAYMAAGKYLYALREAYKKIGKEQFLLGVSAGYFLQGLKYYLAMKDALRNKTTFIKEMIPADLILPGKWNDVRKFPYFYSLFSNIVSPVVRTILKLKSRFYCRGIKLD